MASYNGCPASPDPAVIHVNKDAITRFLRRRKHTDAEPGPDNHPMGATA